MGITPKPPAPENLFSCERNWSGVRELSCFSESIHQLIDHMRLRFRNLHEMLVRSVHQLLGPSHRACRGGHFVEHRFAVTFRAGRYLVAPFG